MGKLFTGFEDGKDWKKHSKSCALVPVGDSLTVQADSRDADINVIMDRYARTGQMPGLSRLPRYGDFDGISDYREAIHAVREAEDLFMRLPAKLRYRFGNDAGAFVDFCEDPKNRLELAELGLLAPEVADAVRKENAKVKENPTDGKSVSGRGSASVAGRDDDSRSSKRSSGTDEGGTDH